jgi:hypothetical protein
MKGKFPLSEGKNRVSDRRSFVLVAVQGTTGCGTGHHKSILVAVQGTINRPSLQYLQILQRYLKTAAGYTNVPPACVFLLARSALIKRAWQRRDYG